MKRTGTPLPLCLFLLMRAAQTQQRVAICAADDAAAFCRYALIDALD
jgi:hypothetical protein